MMAEELNTNGDVTIEAETAEAAPAAEPSADPNAALSAMAASLEAAQAEAADYKDRWLRATAEAQNMRRRFERERSELISSANERLLLRILPVLDDVNLAFVNIPADLNEQDQKWVSGFALIQRKLSNTLLSEGMSVIETEGQEFDPALHEAVSSEPNDSVPSGHVIATLRSGYIYKGKVLRPALVRVAM